MDGTMAGMDGTTVEPASGFQPHPPSNHHPPVPPCRVHPSRAMCTGAGCGHPPGFPIPWQVVVLPDAWPKRGWFHPVRRAGGQRPERPHSVTETASGRLPHPLIAKLLPQALSAIGVPRNPWPKEKYATLTQARALGKWKKVPLPGGRTTHTMRVELPKLRIPTRLRVQPHPRVIIHPRGQT